METITIKRTVIKHILTLLAGLLMCGCSVFLWFIESHDMGILGHLKFIIKPVAVIGGIFFSAATIYIGYTLFAGKSILVINKDGFTDNSSLSSVGFVAWCNVTDISVIAIASQTMIGVKVDNFDQIRARTPRYKRWLISANRKFGYPPITINLNATNQKPEKIAVIMNQHLKK